MKKRIASLLLAVALILSALSVGVMPVSATTDETTAEEPTSQAPSQETATEESATEASTPQESTPQESTPQESTPEKPSELTASDDCIEALKAEEGFSKKPYWDYAQYTVGYGTKCPNDMLNYYLEYGITKEEAEVLLRNHLSKIEKQLNDRIVKKHNPDMKQHEFDALVMFSYNCGTGWTTETNGTFYNAIIRGATGNDLIRAFALWCSAGGQIKTFLLRRRLCEANMYLNAVYSKTPPANYDYVLYDANGGTTSPKSQGYDSDLTAEPFPVPTYAGYIFDGWYTAKTDGEKVTVLDATHAGKTLYAHWVDKDGNPPQQEEAMKPVTVTVTGSDVNLRKGPGTNYATVGTAQKGDQKEITETQYATNYLWGKFDGGWIALEFTNYDKVKDQPTEPDPEPTEPTEPETEPTEPETEPTEPETEPTEPETEPTEPETEPTEPETEPTEPAPKPQTVMGTVNVQEWLRIRSGPGTNYSIVGYLYPKNRVEILEKKNVGSTVWGKISKGWISLDYVILDKTESTDNNTQTETAKWTGVIVDCSELRIRSGAGFGYSVVGYYPAGTKVEIYEKKTGGSMTWGRTNKGWIGLDYVKLTEVGGNTPTTPSQPTTPTEPTTVTGTVTVSDWLCIRSGAGTSYAVTGYLKAKDKVTITERKTVGSMEWGKISKGWISMSYVKLDKTESTGGNTTTTTPTQPAAQKKTITADCLLVRKNASTSSSIVGYLYYGTKVTVTETKVAGGRTWGKISSGWIAMEYTK